jgi:hypothetical protein
LRNIGPKKLQNVIAVTETPLPVLASNAAENSRPEQRSIFLKWQIDVVQYALIISVWR